MEPREGGAERRAADLSARGDRQLRVLQAAERLTADSPEALARIVEGLITGMGFIGGGAILRQQESVRGTATAASLWETGAIGAAVGLGSYDVAVVLTIATIATLWVMAPLKRLRHLEAREQKAAAAARKRKAH